MHVNLCRVGHGSEHLIFLVDMGDGDLADIAERNTQPELHLVDVFAATVPVAIHHQVELYTGRTERVGVGDHAADGGPGGLGIAVGERVVYVIASDRSCRRRSIS